MRAIGAERAVRVKKRRFSVAEYRKMAEVGILSEDDRVELVGGEILEMDPVGPRHVHCVNRLTRLLFSFAGNRYVVSVQNPIKLPDGSEPQPDLALLREREETPVLPVAGDTLLVIEVADTSLAYDREVKLPLYAGAGIPEAWIVDLPGKTVEINARPADGMYRETIRARRGETLAAKTVTGLDLAVNDILG